MSDLPKLLEEIVDEFSLLDRQEKLEYLLYFAEHLSPLPDRLQDKRLDMEEVHECMTPVSIFADMDNCQLSYYFDVPEESPTVRGFAAILGQGLQGSSPEEMLAVPADFYLSMGLHQVLTSQRMNGFSAILAHMKQLASSHIPCRDVN
jgi:cysteine desulfuration protein SufE